MDTHDGLLYLYCVNEDKEYIAALGAPRASESDNKGSASATSEKGKRKDE